MWHGLQPTVLSMAIAIESSNQHGVTSAWRKRRQRRHQWRGPQLAANSDGVSWRRPRRRNGAVLMQSALVMAVCLYRRRMRLAYYWPVGYSAGVAAAACVAITMADIVTRRGSDVAVLLTLTLTRPGVKSAD